ncbi:DEAD/DEAH box helicase [Verrucosispora sp. WMMA2044]|uniref:DEAD/DEAH box helicase n=1 Tax=Verrucosispora sp. WMMA2044 TaxID=3016419 RepID=UPI00248D03B7|nr:DEAD/DEAH box helicase [Verrucosispora sp. WMMA2044]WBB51179.1 DEAD/DEAH box helicase [Verrucosispora sp. WMMA2044]
MGGWLAGYRAGVRMDKAEREELRRLVADFRRWGQLATTAKNWHRAVQHAAGSAEATMRARSVLVDRSGKPAWRVLPLGDSDRDIVRRLRERAMLPATTNADRALLRLLTDDAPRAVTDLAPMLDVRRYLTGPARRQSAATAATFLRHRYAEVTAAEGPERLAQLGVHTAPPDPARNGLDDLLDPALRFALLTERPGSDPAERRGSEPAGRRGSEPAGRRGSEPAGRRGSEPAGRRGFEPELAGRVGWEPELVDRSVFGGLPAALAAIDKVVAGEAKYRSAAREAGEQVRHREVQRILRDMPVEAVRTVTRDRFRLGPLTDAGVTTVQDVLHRGATLQALPGVGETSARRLIGAAHTLRQTTYDDTPVRIDVDHRHPETTHLLRCLAEWDAHRRTHGAAADLERAAELAPLGGTIDRRTSHLLVVPTRGLAASGLRESIEIVERRAELLGRSTAPGRRKLRADPWDDFLARPADYLAMLAELGFASGDEHAAHGDLPDEIIEAVRDQALDGAHLTASLRGYQSFAARFALVQRKVIVGDEMGLGKTVEALAVLAHLHSTGDTHFLVVCPAAVVTNWVREISGKSRLRPHRVHGAGRETAARAWQRDGGVAVTTYETLAWWGPRLPESPDLACVVVDEAHYVKNPQAQRSIRTKELVARADRAILLTGTPLENRVDEFRNLASYVRPDLTVDATDLSPARFRRQIAPAYLRRNQDDVLDELPELIEVEEWLPMSPADTRRYREAVERGNFMQMRQAAMLAAAESTKVQRLVELVREAAENERRIIVFSHFRQVLDLVARTLPGPVFGPLTGSVPANHRQRMVDDFSAARHGAALVAQIVAGGVGLNIQSASVVVICEPQLKPTTEAQAIARAHRMGQVQSVQVHRLLSEEGVDQRITELLAGKRRIFDDFARVSDTADASPEAVDLSEAELVQEVVAAERQRLLAPDLPPQPAPS